MTPADLDRLRVAADEAARVNAEAATAADRAHARHRGHHAAAIAARERSELTAHAAAAAARRYARALADAREADAQRAREIEAADRFRQAATANPQRPRR